MHYTIQTNGTKINADWADFFKQHGFLVGLSVDGPQEMHDAYRVNKGGKGSFDRVMRGWEILSNHGVDVTILCTGVGTFCGILLLMSGNGDPLFLQFKQARESVLEPYCGASPFGHSGQRVVVGQRILQAASDMFLGWTTGTGAGRRHFFLRQLSDAKIKPVIEIMKEANLKNYARLCGMALARAHVRSGDAAVLAGYMGKSTAFEDALADFGVAYADQNERDHAALLNAIRSGRVEARMTE